MGRPKTIYVNADEMLAGIHACYESDLAEAIGLVELTAGSFRGDASSARWERRRLEEHGVEIDFERFAQRGLTPSERIRHQECLRSLEQSGLVRIYGLKATRVRVTPAGLDRLRAAGLLGDERPVAPVDPVE